jgi:glycosyltransferase involved in cell wall biosynthesis
MRKKILVIAPFSKHTIKFIEMIQEKHEVIVLSNSEIDGFKNVIVIKKGFLDKILQLKKIIDLFEPDFIHVHYLSKLHIFYSFFIKNKKSIITTWGSDILIFPKKSIFNKILVKLSLNNFKIITTNEALAMQIILSEYTNKKIIPVHFGVNKYIKFNSFQNKEKIIYSPRSHKDLYNIDLIIKSFAKFLKENPDWKLVLSGREDSINTSKYKKLVKELNISKNVDFVGFLSDKENAEYFYKAMVVVSIPSSDAKSVSLMEAISSNCLCIVSDLPSNKELIIDGINGFIVDHTKEFDLNIIYKIDSLLMEKVNKVLRKNFSYEDAKNRFLKLYGDENEYL